MIKRKIPMSNDGIALIFRLIASGEIRRVDDSRGHYYRVRAEEITKEEFDKDESRASGNGGPYFIGERRDDESRQSSMNIKNQIES